MTRPANQHLDDEELEQLLELPDPTGNLNGEALSPEPAAARIHVQGCKVCEQKLNMFRAAQKALRNLKFGQLNSPPGKCVDESVWPSVAGGILPEDECVHYLAHASRCDRCGAALQNAVADFYDAPTAEEEVILAGIESRLRNWTPPFEAAPHVAQDSRTKPSRKLRDVFFSPPALVFGMVALVACIGLSIAVLLRRPQKPVEQLIGQAYGEDRTMEFRIPYGEPGPIHRERGAEESIVRRPKSLTAAVKAIQDGLSKNGADPVLLDAEARVEMLYGLPDDALKSLQKAADAVKATKDGDESSPEAMTILADTATAHMLRAERIQSGADFAQAEELLGTVLQRNPGDTVALFNLAIAEENMDLYNQAIKHWKLFLTLEKDPKWRQQGQDHLDELERKHPNVGQLKSLPFDAPSAALAEIRARPARLVEQDVDAIRDEEFLTEALTGWLPQFAAQESHPRSPPEGYAANVEALRTLSMVLRDKHHDQFLADLIAGPHSSSWSNAVSELAAAMRSNAQGDVPKIADHALRSLQLFKQARNNAGEAAAAFEYLSSANRSQSAKFCRGAVSKAKAAEAEHYPWVKSNLLFETATCDFLDGEQEAAVDHARQASRLAANSHYKILELEGSYFLDGVSTPWVVSADAWNRIHTGIDEFWRYPYPLLSGEGFYTDLGYAAQAEGLWHCAESIFGESVAIHANDKDREVAAAAHHLLAKAAEAAGDGAIAEAEYREASRMLAGLGDSAQQLRLEFDIERAAMEVNQSRLKAAAATLNDIAPHVEEISNNYALFPYFAALGRLHMLTGKATLAHDELLKAVQLIEDDKKALVSETDLLDWSRNTSPIYRSLLEFYLSDSRDDARTFSFLEWYRAGPLRRAGIRNRAAGTELQSDFTAPAQYRPDHLGLPRGRGLLTWVSFPEKLTIFFLDDGGLHTATVKASNQEVDLVARRFIRLCADPTSDTEALNRDSHQLFEWLLQPIAPYLHGVDTLVVEPDDAFRPIPFQALKTDDDKYLGDLFQIIESPGIGYSHILRAETKVTEKSSVLVVGNPDLDGNLSDHFSPLPEATREASTIAAGFNHPYLLTGGDATLEHVTKLLSQVEIFHFAGHALSGRDSTGLALSSSGELNQLLLLNQSELSSKSLKRLQLVTLSGCETSVANQGLADTESLVRVFLRAGVPNVVASKWSVDSQASANFMAATYRRILQGEPTEKAIAASERELHSDPRTAHPYYWAAFSLFGG